MDAGQDTLRACTQPKRFFANARTSKHAHIKTFFVKARISKHLAHTRTIRDTLRTRAHSNTQHTRAHLNTQHTHARPRHFPHLHVRDTFLTRAHSKQIREHPSHFPHTRTSEASTIIYLFIYFLFISLVSPFFSFVIVDILCM